MFNNPRFITKGFQTTIPIETQLILFNLLDSAKHARELDYLQVFDLSIEAHNHLNLQKIVQSQEQPVWDRTVYYPLKNLVSTKIFVIDDGDHHTFLLADEY